MTYSKTVSGTWREVLGFQIENKSGVKQMWQRIYEEYGERMKDDVRDMTGN